MKARPHLCRTLAAIIAITIFCPFISRAQDEGKPSVNFAYDVDFEMDFDNRELYRSRFSESMTIFGARLTPSVGLSINQKNGTWHKVMLGIDIMKDFGASPLPPELAPESPGEASSRQNNLSLLREFTLYYGLRKEFGKTSMTLYAGIFPRRFTDEDRYSRAFFSDSLTFYDNNLEGLLIKFRRPKAQFEIGCDWMGKYGVSRRERFMIFASGEGKVAPVLSIGYAAYMYHYACSQLHDGVVDNFLANPYLRLDFGHLMSMQRFSVRLGYLQSLQQDRLNIGRYVFPCGGELDIEMRKWDAGIANSFFYGTDMMPYYNSKDASGIKYGNILYMGSPFYRVHDSRQEEPSPGMYDCLEIYYEPEIGGFLKIKAAALFHFNGSRYSGCQQTVSLKFNLHRLLDRTLHNRRQTEIF